jgi:hypothetical protein
MRLFQNGEFYPAYLPRLQTLRKNARTFDEMLEAFLADRYGACHILLPVHERAPWAFYTNGTDIEAQRAWARAHSLSGALTAENILLAQIENHRTEVFYNTDPVRFGREFLRRLPGCVKRTIAWRAAPGDFDLSTYDLVVNNFPGILAKGTSKGWRTAYFFPSYDPVMDRYANIRERPIDVLIVGGYSRHHKRRAQLLAAIVSDLLPEIKVELHLDNSRLTRLAESPIGHLLPLASHRRPAAIREVSERPLFGLEYYAAMSRSKIVLNGAGEIAGNDRGNLRCFESLGCGCLLLSDEGCYPSGMEPGSTFVSYSDPADAMAKVRQLLDETEERFRVARAGHAMISDQYSKQRQWIRFQELCQ